MEISRKQTRNMSNLPALQNQWKQQFQSKRLRVPFPSLMRELVGPQTYLDGYWSFMYAVTAAGKLIQHPQADLMTRSGNLGYHIWMLGK